MYRPTAVDKSRLEIAHKAKGRSWEVLTSRSTGAADVGEIVATVPFGTVNGEYAILAPVG